MTRIPFSPWNLLPINMTGRVSESIKPQLIFVLLAGISVFISFEFITKSKAVELMCMTFMADASQLWIAIHVIKSAEGQKPGEECICDHIVDKQPGEIVQTEDVCACHWLDNFLGVGDRLLRQVCLSAGQCWCWLQHVYIICKIHQPLLSHGQPSSKLIGFLQDPKPH